jgi:hypothetical protein
MGAQSIAWDARRIFAKGLGEDLMYKQIGLVDAVAEPLRLDPQFRT